MSPRLPGAFSRQRLRRLAFLVGVILANSLLLAILGLWWWPASLGALLLVLAAWREVDSGGLLDPLPHRKGRAGELVVGELLSHLPPAYRVHHGLDTGRGNVDHVVIGPTGVFAIETKTWRGRFYLQHGRLTNNGYDADSVLAQAQREAPRLPNDRPRPPRLRRGKP